MTIKWFKSPYNWFIYPLTQPQMAYQQQQQKKTQFQMKMFLLTGELKETS